MLVVADNDTAMDKEISDHAPAQLAALCILLKQF
jgi:hypothetical protein